MRIPTFPECDHDLVKALIHYSDYALVENLQRSPTDGKYFTALFCRYSSAVYSLIWHSTKSPVQADYLFALTWRHILNELGRINLKPYLPKTVSAAERKNGHDANPTDPTIDFCLQDWLVNLTSARINQVKIPRVESIHYVLSDAPPPLWCYTQRALGRLLPTQRLIILMAQTFGWSDTRISTYLQAEGESLCARAVRSELETSYQALERLIPADIRTIYLGHPVIDGAASAEVSLLSFGVSESF